MEKGSKGGGSIKSQGEDLASFKPKTEEEVAKERKSRKWELIAGAIGDGVSSLSNLFFATKGAPVATASTGKQRQPTLMERIYGRHKEEDKAYNANLTAWEKEQEKKRKEADELAKENDVVEDIHDNYKPKTKNWDNEAYIDFVFDKFYKDIDAKTTKINRSTEPEETKGGYGPDIMPGEAFPNESSIMKYINSYDLKGKAKKYFKQMIISRILGGEEKFNGIDEEFLENLRGEMMDMDLNFVK